MKLIKQNGEQVWVTDAPDWNSKKGSTVNVGMTTQSLSLKMGRGQRFLLGQLYGVVCPGLILTQHVFEGLKRPMLVGANTNADSNKLAFTWSAKQDAVLEGDKFQPKISYMEAPDNRVFVVYISPNQMLKEFPDIRGWIEHWAWLAADPMTLGAPVEWQTRYEKKLWSPSGAGA